MILVDTNAWIRFFRKGDRQLQHLLQHQRVVTCDVVLCELLLGAGLAPAAAQLLVQQPTIPSPTAAETRAFLARHAAIFTSSGVGWADLQIVLAAERAGARIYTSDADVKRVWTALGHRLA